MATKSAEVERFGLDLCARNGVGRGVESESTSSLFRFLPFFGSGSFRDAESSLHSALDSPNASMVPEDEVLGLLSSVRSIKSTSRLVTL